MTLGTTRHSRWGQEREEWWRNGEIVSGLGEATKNVHAEMEYFHILFSELRIYFNQTRGDCEEVKKKKSVLYNKFQGNQALLGFG